MPATQINGQHSDSAMLDREVVVLTEAGIRHVEELSLAFCIVLETIQPGERFIKNRLKSALESLEKQDEEAGRLAASAYRILKPREHLEWGTLRRLDAVFARHLGANYPGKAGFTLLQMRRPQHFSLAHENSQSQSAVKTNGPSVPRGDHALLNDLVAIHYRYQDTFQTAVRDAVLNANEFVYIGGRALSVFLGRIPDLIGGNLEIEWLMRAIVEAVASNPSLRVYLLLGNGFSETSPFVVGQADRGDLEERRARDSVQVFIQTLGELGEVSDIRVRLHNRDPQHLVVLTESSAFLESYLYMFEGGNMPVLEIRNSHQANTQLQFDVPPTLHGRLVENFTSIFLNERKMGSEDSLSEDLVLSPLPLLEEFARMRRDKAAANTGRERSKNRFLADTTEKTIAVYRRWPDSQRSVGSTTPGGRAQEPTRISDVNNNDDSLPMMV